jgi:hypothetical protein
VPELQKKNPTIDFLFFGVKLAVRTNKVHFCSEEYYHGEYGVG